MLWDVWECLEVILLICWCCKDCICYELSFMKMIISSLFVWTRHLQYSETWLWQVFCALRKNKKLKRMYHFEWCITRRDWYYISRDVSHAAMDTTNQGTYHTPWRILLLRNVLCAPTDTWTDMSLMGPGLRNNRCISLIRHTSLYLILDFIALHIFIIGELDLLCCGSCETSVLIFERLHWLYKKYSLLRSLLCVLGHVLILIVSLHSLTYTDD